MKSRLLRYKWCLLLPALFGMARGVSAPIHGNFYFRQAHVAANIEKYLADGLSLIPGTYNLDIPFKLFDFPAYQLAVAFLSEISGADSLVLARVLSIVCFLLTLVVVHRLLSLSSVPPLQAFLVVFFFCYAPMNLFYFSSPMVDGLAILLSLVSLYAFVLWEESTLPGPRHWFLIVMVLSGVLSALIKNPVYLSVILAVIFSVLARRGWRGLARPGIVLYAATIVWAVVSFKLLSNSVNEISGFLSDTELQAYFGPGGDRLDPEGWRRIGWVVATQILNPVTAALAIAGVALYSVESGSRHKSIYIGLLLGSAASLLVFFNRHTWHNYYQLPYVFPLAFFAGYAVFRLSEWVRVARPLQRHSTAAPAVILVSVIGFTLYHAKTGHADLSATPTEWIARSGDWIREHSEPSDFVIYVLDTVDPEDWNPVFLYFAKRDGYNLPRRKVRPGVLADLRSRYGSRYARVLVFCPAALHERLRARLDASDAKLIEAGPPGMLYWLPNPLSASIRY